MQFSLMVPAQKQRRPLALMHLCSECALFSVRKVGQNVNGYHQALSLAAPFCVTNDNDSDSTPFSSPSSTGTTDSAVEESSSAVSSPKPAHPRHRSNSECGAQLSPVKSILKRRPMFRSMSECSEEGYGGMMSKYYGNSLEEVSESNVTIDEEGESPTESVFGGFKKKSVSFSERVEENFFRPNSSILGQRKKNQKKNKARKRRESADSTVSGEETEDENRASIENEKILDALMDEIEKSADQAYPSGDVVQVLVSSTEEVAVQNTKLKKTNGKECKSNSKKKIKERKSAPVVNTLLSDDRYKGFVIGAKRRTSSDSAFSVSTDDEDNNNNSSINDTDMDGNSAFHVRPHFALELKDSGIDDEFDDFCAPTAVSA